MSLSRLIGLSTQKERARIDIIACSRLGETFPHTLLHGIGGLGKTSFARAIAEDLGYYFVEKESASLRSRQDIIELLTEMNSRVIKNGRTLLLFLDEIHRLTARQQEVFYFPMIEWRIDCGNEQWYKMKPFTLFGATTKINKLDAASFVGRFGNIWEIESYHDLFIRQMLALMFESEHIIYNLSQIDMISHVCNGVPRMAAYLVKKIRNYVVAQGRWVIKSSDIARVFSLEGIK